jgi:cbb3-type cytochrome oxidase maturation protein
MEALYLLIPLSVVAVFGAAWVFLWMADSGQFDDMDGPAWSVLHDDDTTAPTAENVKAASEPAAPEIDASQQMLASREMQASRSGHNAPRDNGKAMFRGGNERFNDFKGRG